MARLRRAIAIDLGTSSVLIYVNNKGIVVEEPSVIALDELTGDILAVGNEAKKIVGRSAGNVKIVMPLKDGVIADFEATERMLKYFLEKATNKSLLKPDLLICAPSRSSQVEKRALLQASDNAGAHRTYLIEEGLASAIGAGVDIADPKGSLVIDVGGGTTDIAVISMGQIITSSSIPIGGLIFDRAIKDFLRQRYGILIGEIKAEDIKIAASSGSSEGSIEVTGRSITNGLAQKIYLPTGEVFEVIRENIDIIISSIEEVIEVTPPELVSDIYERPVILTGGGAPTLGLAKRIKEKLKIDVEISENPSECVIIGTAKALNWIDSLDEERNEAIKDKQREMETKEKLRRR